MKKYADPIVGRHKVYLSFSSSRKFNANAHFDDEGYEENNSDVEDTESNKSDYDWISNIHSWCQIDAEECVQKSKQSIRWLLDYAAVKINFRISVRECYIF